MNLKKIKEIINTEYFPDHVKKNLILQEIAKDEEALPELIQILDYERKEKKEAMSEMNVLLSQADTIFDMPELNKDKFLQKKITDFYDKHRDTNLGIFHCFPNQLNEQEEKK